MLLLSPQKATVLLYLFFGHYVLFKIYAERRIFKMLWLCAAKCLYFCIFAGMCAGVLLMLSLMPQKLLTFMQMPQVFVFIIGTPILWFILDKACSSVLRFYHASIRPYIYPDKNR